MEKRQAIKEIADVLRQNGVDSYDFEATQMVDFVSGNSFDVNDTDWAKVLEMTSRRLKNEPLQYILGEWEFYGLPVKVGQGVLIPRPDTEMVVEEALRLLKLLKKPAVYDLCAGSGCIGIALAHYGNADVTFFEKSKEALYYLKENLKLNSVQASVKEYDVLTAPPVEKTVDMIVSNPPYIRTEVIDTLSAEVKSEPKMALDGGDDGLGFYRNIAKNWKTALKNGGWLVFEIGFDQEREVIEILKSEGFTSVYCKQDLGCNPRVVIGQYNF